MEHSATFNLVVLMLALLGAAAVVSVSARRLRFPYTILLVIIGLLAGWASGAVPVLKALVSFKLTPDVIVFVFLPVLVFESAFNLDSRALFKNLAPIMTLAVPAMLGSAVIVGAVVHFALGVPLPAALLFGALISATDPVAVISLFKEMGAPKRLTVLVEGESLFNDATALVLFKILLGVVAAGVFAPSAAWHGVASFFIVFLGGTAVGSTMGYVFSKLIERVENDRFVEITLTTVLAHSAFIVAEGVFHVSGVMSTVAAGLVLGGYGRTKISPQVLEHMESFWEYFAFICNSLIFLLVGLSVELPLFAANLGSVFWAVVAVLAARAIVVYTLTPLVGKFRGVEKVSWQFQTVIFWGGLRGALAIAMVLSIPESIEQRAFFIVLTVGIVLFTLLVNGLTVRPLMHALGLDRYSLDERFERAQAALRARNAAVEELESLAKAGGFGPKAISAASASAKAEGEAAMREIDALHREAVAAEFERRIVFRHALLFEKAGYRELFEEGLLSEENLRELSHRVDVLMDQLKESADLGKQGKPGDGEGSFFGSIEAVVLRISGRLAPLRTIVRRYKTLRIARSYERKRARLMVLGRMDALFAEMGARGSFNADALGAARKFYSSLRVSTERRLLSVRAEFPEYVDRVEETILRRTCLRRELQSLQAQVASGALPEKIFHDFEERIAAEARRLRMPPVEELLIPAPRLMAMVPYFSEFPPEDLARITASVSVHSFLPGEEIVREGDEGSSLYIIGRGKADVSTKEEGGGEHVIAMLGAGEFFGEIALLHPQPRTATVRAYTPCTLLELSREALIPYLDAAPHLRETLESAYQKRMAELEKARHLH